MSFQGLFKDNNKIFMGKSSMVVGAFTAYALGNTRTRASAIGEHKALKMKVYLSTSQFY